MVRVATFNASTLAWCLVSERISGSARCAHYWAGDDESRELDYLLIASALAAANHNAPEIMREGLPWRAEGYDGEGFEEVGENHPKASGHCPLYVGLEVT